MKTDLFNDIWEKLKEQVFNMISSRLIFLILLIATSGAYLIYVLFNLQIVHGEEYFNNFQLKITKEKTLESTRGNIYDRNGLLLAYNELAYSVTIEDVYESGRNKNKNLNNTIYQMINLIESNGDSIVDDFNIELDRFGRYQYKVSDNQLLRFLADVYGYSTIDELKVKEKTATPDEVIKYLCSTSRYGIGNYTDPDDSDTFVEGLGYTKEEVLKIINVRYAMSANSYQKYIATTVANNVSEKTVSVIMENEDLLEGVSVSEGTVRKYLDSVYISQIVGYTGKISNDELEELQAINPEYDLNDTVGKSGIEESMETYLQGKKGSETVYVDNLGKVIETSDRKEAVAGNDVYLTIDLDLQKYAYDTLESKLAAILLLKIQNIREYKPSENSSNSDIAIPIYDVYFACIDNNLIDTSHFSSKYAQPTEQKVYEAFLKKKDSVFERLSAEFNENYTEYNKLSKEYQVYESYIVNKLYKDNILISSEIDSNDPMYVAWTTEETVSIKDFLTYAIANNWIDVSILNLENQYSDSSEIYDKIVGFIFEELEMDNDFYKKMYRYMINNDEVTGKDICNLLLEQDIVSPNDEEIQKFRSGAVTPYAFMRYLIEQLEITPADLALDPYCASIIITDVNTGDVLALASYPSYDNNKMANGVNSAYYAKIRDNKAYPLLNYATQQKTAPGSTYKMVVATAGLCENVITTTSNIVCNGTFEKIIPSPRCWIASKGSHGMLNVSGAIQNSCNCYFYEVGYRLGLVGDALNNDVGLNKLAKYAEMFGLTEKSGVEIDEVEPEVSDLDCVRSAIGQGTNNFTAVGLSRYVTTVANGGTCYNLTLVDRIEDHNGGMIKDNSAEVRNIIDMDPSFWKAIHLGMRRVVESKSYFSGFGVDVAGKTGTAQESKSRPNHALFVSYAPYEKPEISVTVRVANGYTSDYAAQIAKEVYKYYFDLEDPTEENTNKVAGSLEAGTLNGD